MSAHLVSVSGTVRHNRTRRLLAPGVAGALAVLLLNGAALAQQGTVAGRVVDAEAGQAVVGADVRLIRSGGSVVQGTTTDNSGAYRLTGIAQGKYSLIFSSLGYETQRVDGIDVGTGTLNVDLVQLKSVAFALNPIVVSASRDQEKALAAPAAIYTIDSEEIDEATATTVVDYVRTQPGTDVATNGVQQSTMVLRGFNNVFSGALFVLTDNRWASVPSLRFNAYDLLPIANDDIERVEVVLGPGSALYGPNVANGVVHMITRSPLDRQETIVSLAGGYRGENNEGGAQSIWQGTLRHSGLINQDVGYKISASYLNGTDWVFIDPAEPTPSQRDFNAERLTADARLDVRFDDQSVLTLNGGTAGLLSSIELTGIGAAQAVDWFYSYVQGRYRRGPLFAQGYVNFSESGDSFTLRDGRLVSDNSLLYSGQIQHAAPLGPRQRFTYGVDFIRTVPKTNGTIHGDNEDSDNITEIGGYLQSETNLSPQFDLFLAARVDYNDPVDKTVFSPRAAIVYKPTLEHSLRATYNRAFTMPTSVNLFLDLPSSIRDPLAGRPFGVFAGGVPSGGYTFARGSNGDPLMRTFFAALIPGVEESDLLPLDATLLWPVAIGILQQNTGIDLSAIPAPTAAQVGTQLRALNTTDLTFRDVPVASVEDIAGFNPTIWNTLEAGYKGLIGDRLLLDLNAYYTRVEDFISPLRVETPNVFLDTQSLAAYLAMFLPPGDAAQIAAAMGGISESTNPATRGIPLATVTPANTPSPGQADVLLTYRQFSDEVDLWGVDVGLNLVATNWLSFTGSYSYVSDDLFTGLGGGLGIVALNAPQNKASLGAQYQNPRLGLTIAARGRWIDSFPVQSGVYVGTIEDYALADLNITYTFPFYRTTSVSLTGQNIFDDRHLQMIGAPQLSQLWLLRFRWDLPR